MKEKISIYLKFVNIFLIILGIISQSYFHQSLFTNSFLSFTVQSNILVILTSFLSLLVRTLLDKNHNKRVFRFVEILELISAVAISLTFIIFNFLLAPGLVYKGNIEYIFSFQSIVLHFISPLLNVIPFLFLEKRYYHFKDSFFGVTFPFYYIFFVFFCNFMHVKFNKAYTNEKYFPYFFMNYYDNGFFKVGNSILEIGFGYWLILFSILTAIITLTYMRIIKKHQQ